MGRYRANSKNSFGPRQLFTAPTKLLPVVPLRGRKAKVEAPRLVEKNPGRGAALATSPLGLFFGPADYSAL